jgi:glutathione S-transferase
MGCGKSQVPPQAQVEKKVGGNVSVYGVYVSANCMGPVLLAVQVKCGSLVATMPGSGTQTAEFLKMNPFHCVPTIKDDDFSGYPPSTVILAESNSILRYLAGTYAPDLYINLGVQRRSFVDWAMDRFASTMYLDVTKTIYVAMGFVADAPADEEVGKKVTENLQKFADVFLQEKFIGGSKLSIADYKVAPFFFTYAHPSIATKCLVKVPERILQFNFDFAEACKEGALLLSNAEGNSIKEYLDTKAGGKQDMIALSKGFDGVKDDAVSKISVGGKDAVKVYGVTVSMNCVGPILFGKHAGIGGMETCMPGEQSQSDDHKKINPFGGVPAIADGDWKMGESNAILRHMARTYAEEYYPRDPKRRAHIDWAIDRFTFGMYNDVVDTIYVCMGFRPEPKDGADGLKAAGKTASENLKEFAEFFLKEKFVGGLKLSIADFKVAPFFAAYAHPRVTEKCGMTLPKEIVDFNANFLTDCTAATLFSSAEKGFSICQYLDSKTEEEKGGPVEQTKTQQDMQAAMETEAQKQAAVAEAHEEGPKIESATASICC